MFITDNGLNHTSKTALFTKLKNSTNTCNGI